MIVSLCLVLLCALGMALPSPTLAMGAPPLVSAPQAAESTIHADIELPTSFLQTSDVAELLAKLERSLADGTTGMLSLPWEGETGFAPRDARGARASDDATRWCSLVQCRRLSGAQLLRYATPPPADCLAS